MRTSTVWPGAQIDDSSAFSHWFGIFACYTSIVFLVLSTLLTIAVYVWLGRKLWRMCYRGEEWWP